MFRNNYVAMAIISAVALHFTAILADDDPALNLREKCRRTISGFYSSAIADLRMAKDAVTLAENYKKKSQHHLDENEKKLRAVNKKLESRDYTPDLLSERDVLNSQIKLYHEQLISSDTQLVDAKRQLKDAKTKESRLGKNIRAIFTIFMAEDPEGGPQPIYNKIEWKSSCPKYRVLCPLPNQDVEILRQITKDIEDIESSCHRYSNLK